MTERDTRVRAGEPNVYRDLGLPDAEGMFVKAQLAMRISDAIAAKRLTQTDAAALMGLPQPKLSNILRGHFHGVSETKMMECLAALGQNVDIVVTTAPRGRAGRVSVASRRPSA